MEQIKEILNHPLAVAIFNVVWPWVLVRFREWVKPSAAHKADENKG